MKKRFVAIWFRYLRTDWFIRHHSYAKDQPLVLTAASHGRKIIVRINVKAEQEGVFAGMNVADARALIPSIQVADDLPQLSQKLTRKFAFWLIRYSPFVSIDGPDGLILDASGCTHLWGGEDKYIEDIQKKAFRFWI